MNSVKPSSVAISSLRATGPRPASRLMRESSESSLCGLIARSMRCISSMTASMAATPWARSSHQSSALIEVPMIASSRRSQMPPAAPERAPGAVRWSGMGLRMVSISEALRGFLAGKRTPRMDAAGHKDPRRVRFGTRKTCPRLEHVGTRQCRQNLLAMPSRPCRNFTGAPISTGLRAVASDVSKCVRESFTEVRVSVSRCSVDADAGVIRRARRLPARHRNQGGRDRR